MGGQCQWTQVCVDGSKHPHWNETLTFRTTDLTLRVEVWDRDTTVDDIVGAGSVNLGQFLNANTPTSDGKSEIMQSGSTSSTTGEVQAEPSSMW
jgi:hypothetical protein